MQIIKQTALMVSLSLILFPYQASATSSQNRTDLELQLLQELTKLNKRIDELNTKVVKLERGKKQTHQTAKNEQTKPKKQLQFARAEPVVQTQTDAAPTWTDKKPVLVPKKHVSYAQNKVWTKNEEGVEGYQYLDKNRYDLSPDQLNRTTFMQIINQNSPESTAYNNLCLKNALCFSGLGNFDLRYYNRAGGIETIGNQQASSLVGVGVRPLFGQKDTNLVGSINNANLFIDAYVNPYVLAHMNLAYVNGSVKSRTYAHNDPDWSSVYRNAAAIKMDEIFGTLIVPNTPFFARVGKQYLNFGDYKPYPISESLVQLVTQIRTGAFVVGAVFDSGLYGSANYSMARQTLENLSHPVGEPFFPVDKTRNFGGKIGYQGRLNGLTFDMNASYIDDLRDSDYLNANTYLWTYDVASSDSLLYRGATTNQIFVMNRAPGVAAHLDAHWQRFGMLAEYTSALEKMSASPNSQIHAFGLHGNVTFEPLGYQSLFDLGYERAYDAQVFNTVVIGPLPQIPGISLPLMLANALPQSRIVGTFSVTVLPEITLSAQWLHDKDFPISQMGTGRSSDMGTLRISTQF